MIIIARIIIVLLAALFVNDQALQVKANADSGYDGDTHHCVTHREVFLIGRTLTRSQIEKRWEVEGRGERASVYMVGRSWVYPVCEDREQIAFFKRLGDGYAAIGITSVDNVNQRRVVNPDGLYAWLYPKHAKWSPCEPITVSYYGDHDARYNDFLIALQDVTAATRLPFVLVADYSPADVTVGWHTPQEDVNLANVQMQPGGAGGYTDLKVNRTGKRFKWAHIVLDKVYLPASTIPDAWVTTMFRHEFAHAVGLDHIDNPTSVLGPNMYSTAAEYGPGDLIGLATVGWHEGDC